jgi:Right handed beta helix region
MVVVALAACTSSSVYTVKNDAVPQAAPTVAAGPHAPTTPPAQVCGSKAVLDGPATAPNGAITVPAGDNAGFNFRVPGTTYWFAPGIHTLGSGAYSNIDPASHDTYIGAPGAILDGEHENNSAFDDTSDHVVIEYLTVRNFGTWGGDQQEGVVNHDSGQYWTISHSTIIDNAGAGVMLGSDDKLTWNCLQDNQQYGFNAYSNAGQITNIVLDHNEIVGNDTYNYEAKEDGCGCSGGGKFWNVVNAAVTNNWVVDNKSVGLWADTDNAGFEFVGNFIQNNQEIGLQYEISYNAIIEYNTFKQNGVSGGPANGGFPTSAIYISESGSDSRVKSNYRTQPFLIEHNDFLDNWGGVILWENSNRFCGSPDNSSSGYCTVVDPNATLKTCATSSLIRVQPYLSDCRWRTQNVLVAYNEFSFTPAAVGKKCAASTGCGYNGVFSEYGSDPSWSPFHGDIVPGDITFHQNNKFEDNAYVGPWCFMGWQLGTAVDWAQWRAPANMSDSQFGQDAKSVHKGASWACN